LGAIVAPREVLRPPLPARIEQGHPLSCGRVDPFGLGTFVGVAHPAAKPKVLLIVGAAGGGRNDVLDLEPGKHQPLGAQAVATALPRLGADTVTDGLANRSTAHGCNCSRKPRCTASCSAWALSSSPRW